MPLHKRRDFADLQSRARAALETPADLSPADREALQALPKGNRGPEQLAARFIALIGELYHVEAQARRDEVDTHELGRRRLLGTGRDHEGDDDERHGNAGGGAEFLFAKHGFLVEGRV